MKRKQVVKMLSIGMAGILAVSSCNGAGSMVYAEEASQENVVEGEAASESEEEQENETEKTSTVQEKESSVEQETEETTESTTEELTSEDTLAEETSEEEISEEGFSQEETSEEETSEELTEIAEEEQVALAAGIQMEETQLQQFYGQELTFDSTSGWDEKGENHLGLHSDAALNSGTKVSFEMYIPAENAEYEGLMKVQGIARLGSNWTWTQNDVIPELGSSDFTEEVEIDGKLYKKAHVTFTFGDEITSDYLAEFTVKLAGWMCNYTGSVYYGNVSLENGEEAEPDKPVQENVLASWNFDQDINGWYYDGVWDNQGENSLDWSGQYQALALKVDYSKDVKSTWSEIKASYRKDDFKVKDANKITFDFIYNPEQMTKGSFKVKLFANSGIDTNTSIYLDQAEDYADGLKVVHFSMNYDTKDIENGFTIGIIGSETDYQGMIYLDNVTLMSETKQEDDIYVDATEQVTGQEMKVSVQGDTLITGAGSSAIAKDITLVDGQAKDSVKQVYAYLQAVGKTDSVIFGQQNNTSHKAGSSDLSCSDTMDVVSSYTGVIGLDGLSLAGDEYSADRYLSEMQGQDSAYDSVAAQINQASTQIEKNVIAAAALTNYNIRNGAIATLSLHMPNFSSVSKTGNDTGVSYAGYNFSGYTPNLLTGDVMNQILPGGAYNDAFCAYLDMVADYAHQVNGAVLFRPFHENTGSWFWWGAAFCDEQTYKSAYKYTVEYLRDEKNVHNFLYVYGPGSEAASVEEYAARYPGDGYVDMVGFDMYHSNPQQGDSFVTNFTKELQIVDDFAQAHGKLVAVTETGTSHDVAEGDNQTALLKKDNARPDWYQEILNAVKGSNASYYLVWANFGEKDGFYTPYVKSVKEDGTKHGHEMMDSFIRFFNQDNSIFAINQKDVLEQMKTVSIQAKSASTQSGYIVSPVAGSRILEAIELTAKVSGVTDTDQVTFVLSGKDKNITLQAQITDGYATAQLDQETLNGLGEAVGTISLVMNGTTIDTIRATFNIPEPEQDPYEIDGFENYYGVDTMLTKNWATNKATGSSIAISLSRDYSYEGEYVMKFEYAETPDGWAGATISKEVDWTDCDALQFWIVPDGKQQKTVIQITAGGNVYEYYMNLNDAYCEAGTEPVLVTIPFALFVARDISGNPAGGLGNDKNSITSVGLWVNAIAGSAAMDEDNMVRGAIYYDGITAVKSGKTEAEVKKIAQTPTQPSKPDVSPQPSKPEVPTQSTEQSEESGTQSTEQTGESGAAAVAQVVEPVYVTADGMQVRGWDAVMDAAYRNAQLTSQQASLADSTEAAQSRLTVDINLSGVTQLTIPQTVVAKMKQSQADYNFYIRNIAITVSADTIASWNGEMNLEVYLEKMLNFGEGFDAFCLRKNRKAAVLDHAVINVALSTDKAGSIAYIFGKNAQSGYQLLYAEPVSGLGTAMIEADSNEEYLILY